MLSPKRTDGFPSSLPSSTSLPQNRLFPLYTHYADRGPYSQSYGFSSSHVRMWELEHQGGWAPKNWCFLIVVLEKTLESSLYSKEIKPVNPKGNQPWIFIGRTAAEAEAPILWLPDAKSWLIGKDPDAAKDWRQEEKGMTEDGMVGWYHQLNGHEFEQTPGAGEGQRNLRAIVHGVAKSWTWLSDWTELNWTDNSTHSTFLGNLISPHH